MKKISTLSVAACLLVAVFMFSACGVASQAKITQTFKDNGYTVVSAENFNEFEIKVQQSSQSPDDLIFDYSKVYPEMKENYNHKIDGVFIAIKIKDYVTSTLGFDSRNLGVDFDILHAVFFKTEDYALQFLNDYIKPGAILDADHKIYLGDERNLIVCVKGKILYQASEKAASIIDKLI
ncbi:MAG: hypothetical protein LBN07_04060 [Christensenellaceae bacterium]|jgi:hypothetical protein|nr:hypothetical protein [Christensenellaceae bacterium]